MAGKTGEKVQAKAGAKVDGIHKPVTPSKELAEIVGAEPIARGEVVSRIWRYIKEQKLQDPKDGRQINADPKLKPIFGKDSISMFEMNKRLSQHLS